LPTQGDHQTPVGRLVSRFGYMPERLSISFDLIFAPSDNYPSGCFSLLSCIVLESEKRYTADRQRKEVLV